MKWLAAVGATLMLAVAGCGGGSDATAGTTSMTPPRVIVAKRLHQTTGAHVLGCSQGYAHECFRCTVESGNPVGNLRNRRLVLTVSERAPLGTKITGCEVAGDPSAACAIESQEQH
jgi:hypothetical protein